MSTPLFDTHLVTRNLERAYEAMWETRELGLPPGHIGERLLTLRMNIRSGLSLSKHKSVVKVA